MAAKYVLALVALFVVEIYAASNTVHLKVTIDEESPSGTVVADLTRLFGIKRDEQSDSDRHFKLLEQKLVVPPFGPPRPPRKLVALDYRTGIITLRHPVDRDVACRGMKDCVIKVQAVMLPQSIFSLLNLEIYIDDVNDHAPVFPTRPIEVNVSESVSVGDVINLDKYQARDADSGNNSAIRYSLSNNGNFQIIQSTDETGRSHIDLLVLRELDYERKHFHHVTLTATDQGQAELSDHVTIKVRVIDANDNAPVFEKQDYVVALRENLEPGSPITQVRARDPDAGANGTPKYGLVSDPSLTLQNQLVNVDRDTGLVTLRQKLDRESHDGIRILIEATDSSATDQKSARAFLTLHVEDVNDNAPVITVNYIVDAKDNTAYISEESPVGTYLAYVSANDLDHGNNGEVEVTIWTQPFDSKEYSAVDTGHFVLAADGLIGSGKELNREVENRFKLVVSACDKGTPARCTFSNITVAVLDENDNSPIFVNPKYEVTLPENADVGSSVITVSAKDEDSKKSPVLWKNEDGEIETSKNGDVTYSIESDDNSFTVDSRSGKVTLIRPLDRERHETLQLKIVARDGGRPKPRVSTCTLKVNVKDVNDNNPIFTNPAVDNSAVYATILNNDIITQIQTVDYDAGENGRVTLELESVDGKKGGAIVGGEAPYSFFVFDPSTGDLRLNLTGDEPEKMVGEHILVLTAKDWGVPRRQTSVNLEVRVSDTLLPPSLQYGPGDVAGASITISTEFLVIVVSLAAATLLLVVVIAVVVVKCRKDNKKVRTYNCRDAENKSGWLESSKDVINNDVTTNTWPKSVASDDVTQDGDVKISKEVSKSESFNSTRKTSDSARNSISDVTSSSRHDYVASYHVMAERPPTSLSTFSCDGKIAHAKVVGLIPPPASHDGDSGRGDSDPDSNSFQGIGEREYQQPLLDYSHYEVKPNQYDHVAPSSGSRCTEECLKYGHSDLCWMPSPTKVHLSFPSNNYPVNQQYHQHPNVNQQYQHVNHMHPGVNQLHPNVNQLHPAVNQLPHVNHPSSDFQNEYNRVLETIEESSPNPDSSTRLNEYELDSNRHIASESRFDKEKDAFVYDVTPRHSWNPSPAPSSGVSSSHFSEGNPRDVTMAGVSLLETREIIADIDRLLEA